MSRSLWSGLGLVLIGVFFLPACGARPGVPGVAALATNTATALPADAPAVPMPTVTATAALPVATATPRAARIDPATVAQVRELATWKSTDGGPVKQLCWSSDSRTLASLQTGQAVIWDVAGGRARRIIDGPRYSASLSPDGRLLAAGLEDYTVRLYDVDTGREVRNLGKHSSAVNVLPFSPDGRILFAGSVYGPQKFWQVESGQMAGDLDSEVSGVVTSAAFNWNGRMLAVGTGSSRGGGIELWDVATPEMLDGFFDARDDKYSVAFAPDGRSFASGSLYGSVKLWDINTRRAIADWQAQRSSIESVGFTPSGELLVVATRDGVHLLRVPALSELRVLTGHAGEVQTAALSPDGRLLASASQDGEIKLWGLEP